MHLHLDERVRCAGGQPRAIDEKHEAVRGPPEGGGGSVCSIYRRSALQVGRGISIGSMKCSTWRSKNWGRGWRQGGGSGGSGCRRSVPAVRGDREADGARERAVSVVEQQLAIMPP